MSPAPTGAPAAMILAAGRGERMRPLSLTLAKPALPVMGKSILARVMAHLERAGVRRFAVNAFHGAESVRLALEHELPEGCSAELFVETELMGTGGALAAPADFLAAGHEFFLLHNGDTILEFPMESLLAATKAPRCLGALLVRPESTPGYRPVGCRQGRLTGLSPGPADDAATYLGVAAVHTSILENVPRDRASSLFPDLLLPQLEKGYHLAVVPYDGPWFEFTSAESYLSRSLALLASRGGRYLDPQAHLDEKALVTGSVSLEPGAQVLARARVHDAVLMAGSIVSEGAQVTRGVLAPGAVLAQGKQLHDGVLTKDPEGGMIYFPFKELGQR